MEYTKYDRRIASASVSLVYANKMVAFGPNRIEFQFPPRVKSDSRTGEWTAMAASGGKSNSLGLEEPVYTYQGGNPRKIQMEWDYLVTDGEINAFNQGGLAWTVDRITRNLRTLRRYAANPNALLNNGVDPWDQLVIKLILYDIGGQESMSYRSDGVTITYDDGLFTGSDRTFPLKTTVAMTLYSWPIVGPGDGVVLANGQVRTFVDWY